jgi:hypothetical protein
MSPRQQDSALMATVIDAAAMLDDFVRGVVALGDGVAGGAGVQDGVVRRALRFLTPVYGAKQVVQGMGAAYAPEQLRKAASEADRFVVALEALAEAGNREVRRAAQQVFELGAAEFPSTLRRNDLGSRSPELRSLYEHLAQTTAILNQARTRLVLDEMRANPTTDGR